MKHKTLVYSLLPAIGLFGVFGVSLASAHGLFGGFGFDASVSDDFAAREESLFQNTAQVLGISADELKEAWAEGKTPHQIIQEKGLDISQIKSRAVELRMQQIKTQLQSLVDKGIVTQAQADKRLSTVQNRMQNGMDRMGRLGWGLRF